MENKQIGSLSLSRREALGVAGIAGTALAVAQLAYPQSGSAPPSPATNPAHKMTKDDVDRWMTELSNWGRWGKDDQLGTLNLITPAKRKEAAGMVKEGIAISLAHDLLKEKAADNASPFIDTVQPRPGNYSGTGFGGDNYSVSYHGFAHTHMDALWHANYQGKMYNGYSIDTISPETGGSKDSILVAKNGVFTRGVLMDIAKLKGVDYLEPGTPIYPEDLDAWEKEARVKVSSGDVIFIRTGRWARRAALGPWNVGRSAAGLHASCAKWLKSRDVAVLASDVAQDVSPSQVDGVGLPIHQMVLVALGLYIFDNCDLEQISQEAAKRKRWAFLVTAAPLAVPGGSGSPINPIAMF
jgi:kynurenine formamidase